MAAATRSRLSRLHRPPSRPHGRKSALPGFLRSGALNNAGPNRSQTLEKTGVCGALASRNCEGSTCYGSYVDELLSYTVGATRYFTHSNHLYSPAAITNAAGAVVERMRYDAYGKQTTLNAAGTTELNKSTISFDRGFTGYILDGETGLYYARARMYSAGMGRFSSWDPRTIGNQQDIGIPVALAGYSSGPNLYGGYFSPNYVDPYGMYPVEKCTIVVWIGHGGINGGRGGKDALDDTLERLRRRKKDREDGKKTDNNDCGFMIGFVSCFASPYNDSMQNEFPDNALQGLPPMSGFGYGVPEGEDPQKSDPEYNPATGDFDYRKAINDAIAAAMDPAAGKKVCDKKCCTEVTVKVHCAPFHPQQDKGDPREYTKLCGKSMTVPCAYFDTDSAPWSFGRWK